MTDTQFMSLLDKSICHEKESITEWSETGNDESRRRSKSRGGHHKENTITISLQ